MTEILWPLVAAGLTLASWDAVRRWVARDSKHVREFKAELVRRDEAFGERFAKYERAYDQLVTRFNNTNPSPNPLGKHYSTQKAG